ncbi:MAG: Fur family transcriptional regulator [Dehalococcoidia bacterium]
MIGSSIEVIRSRGYKATRPRKLVLEVLETESRPVSPYEIQSILRMGGRYLNHVTIYRTLDLLCSLNLAHRVLSSGKYVRCSLPSSEACHRFMVCQNCGVIREFADMHLCHEENEFARGFGFHTEHHLSEFCGLCSSCYRSNTSTYQGGKSKWVSE